MAEFLQIDDDNFIIPREVYRVKRGPTTPAAADGTTEEQETCTLYVKGAEPIVVNKRAEDIVDDLEADND